ncbi:MFS transporter [Longispora albida]|uniref:MFS transporter n=1 Tax=Longispora albida TaxID=203523 RepID=UPI00036FFC4D|nr:MFS transporter [Longispora albida]
MTHPAPLAATRTPGGGQHHTREGLALIGALAVTQTIGYGVLFYVFAVFLTSVTRDLHTTPAVVTGALTLGILVTAAASVPAGRWLDRHGGRALMTAGSVLAVISVLAWSQVRTPAQLYAVFALIGLASAMVLYEPAFAVVIRHFAQSRRQGALLAVTLVAGFASSIFLPLAGQLEIHLGWRNAVVVLAAILAVTIPLHAFAVPKRHTVQPKTSTEPGDGQRRQIVHTALRERGFWLLTLAFLAQGAAVAAISVHLIAYLTSRGHSPAFAATTAGLLGVLSVTGRILTTGVTRRLPIGLVTAAVFALQAAAAAALPALGGTRAGAIICVTAFGLGFGVAAIARSAILAARYGTTAYATLSGAQALPITLAKAAAPLAAAGVAAASGYSTVPAAAAGACVLAAVCLFTARQPAG